MKQNAEEDASRAPCERVFDQFVTAATCKSILASFQQLLDATGLRHVDHSRFSSSLRDKLKGSWKAQNLWSKLDKRASHKDYKKGQACSNIKVLIIGSGPCGLRTAVECAFLGAKTVIVEKRDRFSRNNVLHLWPYLITDLGNLGAKMFFGKFCAGAIDHISIRQLQCILLKVALLLGVEVHMNVTFEDLIEPPANQSSGVGWRCKLTPRNHPLSEYDFDVLIGADGKRNTLPGFKRKEFRGKLAIAITANFINRNTQAEARVEEISGVAFIFNQKFFMDLKESTRIDLENIVYYKDDTHYFVMTAKKASLLEKRVLRRDFSDTLSLLDKSNVDQDALKEYAEEAANFSTNYQLPSLEYAVNHYGQADVAMFDFTSMFAAENASRFIFRNGHHLLIGLVGDSLLEPFWPTGSGCARGFLGAFDAAWMIRSWALGKTPLQVLSERESVYTVLSQTTPGYLMKNHSQYSIDPNTRYPNLNLKAVHPSQVRHLYEGDGPGQLREQEEKENCVVVSAKKARKVEVCGADSSKLLLWCQGILNTGKFRGVHVADFTHSWRSGLALCALIQSFRPEIIDCSQMLESDVASNNQLAFDVAEKELGIPPVMTGEDMAKYRVPDMLTMVSYLTQFYDLFKNEPTFVQVQVGTRNEAKGTDTRQLKSPRGSNRRISFIKKLSNRLARSKKRKEHEANEGRALGSITFQEKDETMKSPEPPSEKKVCLSADGRSEARMKTSKGETISVPAMADILVAKFRDLEGKPAQEPVRKMKGQLADFTTPTAGTASEICFFCQKRVYIMERLSAEGEFFHRSCLKCEHCGTGLRLTNYFCDRDVKPVKFYCSRHAVPEMRTCSPRKRALMDIVKENVPDVVVTAPPKTDTDQASQEKLPRKSISVSGSSHLSVPDVTPQAKRSTLERVEFEISFDGEEESEEEQLEHNLRASLTSVAVISDEDTDSDSSGSSFDPGFEYRMQDNSEVVSKVSSSSAQGNRNASANSQNGERMFGSLFKKGATSKDIGEALASAGETEEGFRDHQPVTPPTSPGSPAADVFSDHKLNRLDPSLMFRKDHKTSDRNGLDESHPTKKTSHTSENKISDSEIKADHARKDMPAVKEKAQDLQISETHGVKHVDSITSSSRDFERMKENMNSEDNVREESSKQENPIIKKSKKFGITDFFTKKRDTGKFVESDEGSIGKDAEKKNLKAQVTKQTNGDKSFTKSSEEELSGKKAEKKYSNQKAQATKRANEDKSLTKSSEEESDSGTNKVFIEARLSPSVRRTKNFLKKHRPRHVKEKRTSKASGKYSPNSNISETKIPLSCQDELHDAHSKLSTKQDSKLGKDSKEQFGELLQKLKKCNSLEAEEISDTPRPVSTSINDQSSKSKNSEVLSGNVQSQSHEDAGPKAERRFRSVFMQNREQALQESKSNREEKVSDLNSSFSISTPSDSESSVSSVDLEDLSHGNRPSRNNKRSVEYRLRSGEGGSSPGKVSKVGLDEPSQGKRLLSKGGSGENSYTGRMIMKENVAQSVLSKVAADLKTKNAKREPAGSGSTPVALTRPLPLVQAQAAHQEVRSLLSSPEDKSMVVQQRPNALSSPSKDSPQGNVRPSPVKNRLESPFVYKLSSSGSTSSPSSKPPAATAKPELSTDSPQKTNPLLSNLTDHSSISTASSTTNSPKTPLTPQQKTSHHLLSKLNLFSKKHKDPPYDDSSNTSDRLNSSSPQPQLSTPMTNKSSTDLPTKNMSPVSSTSSSTPSSAFTSPTNIKKTDLPLRSNSAVSSTSSSTPSSTVTSPTGRKVTDLPYRSNSTVSSPTPSTSSTSSSSVTSPASSSNVFGNLSPSLTAFLENKAKQVDPSSAFLRKYNGLEKMRVNTEAFEKHQEPSSPSTRPTLVTSPDPSYVLSDSNKKLPHSPGVLSVQQIRDMSKSDKEKGKSNIQKNPKSNHILGITCMNPGFDVTGEITNKKRSMPQSPYSIAFSDDQKTSSDLFSAKEGNIINTTPGKSKKKKIKPTKAEAESVEPEVKDKKKKSIMSLIRLTKTKKGSKDTDQPLSPDCSPNENGPILKTKSKEKPPKKDKKSKKLKGKNVLEGDESSLTSEYSKDLAVCSVFHSRSSEKARKGLVDARTTKKYLQLPSAASSEDLSDSDDSHISVSSARKSKNEDPQARASRRMLRIYQKRRKEADQKRLRMAQEIQRQLEEVEVRQTDMEKRGIAVEKAIRENNFDDGNRSQLMSEWFTLVQEKNAFLRYESELMVRAKELELEDTQGRLEMEYRDRSRKPEKEKKKGDVAAEKRILDELLDVVEQRNNLVAMLEEERLREQKEDHELKTMMAKKGFVLSPLSFDTWREQQTIEDILPPRTDLVPCRGQLKD